VMTRLYARGCAGAAAFPPRPPLPPPPPGVESAGDGFAGAGDCAGRAGSVAGAGAGAWVAFGEHASAPIATTTSDGLPRPMKRTDGRIEPCNDMLSNL